MLGIGREFSIFLSACLTGNFICLVYSAIRLFRRIVKHTLFWISIEDLIFWIFSSLYIFSEMFRMCNGSIRWYFVLGVFWGGILTLRFFEKTKKIIDKSKKTR